MTEEDIHPEAKRFLEHVAWTEQDRRELREHTARLESDKALLERRVEFLEAERVKEKRRADSFQGAYLEMKAQVAILGAAAISALEASKRELIHDGFGKEADGEKPAAHDDIRTTEIARKFAAGQVPLRELLETQPS